MSTTPRKRQIARNGVLPVDQTLQDAMRRIDQFAHDRDWDQFHSPKNLAASIAIEASELLERFQWTDVRADDLKQDTHALAKVSSEIADVLNYALRLCSILDLNPVDVVLKKLNENAEKYPVELAHGTSKKYTEL